MLFNREVLKITEADGPFYETRGGHSVALVDYIKGDTRPIKGQVFNGVTWHYFEWLDNGRVNEDTDSMFDLR